MEFDSSLVRGKTSFGEQFLLHWWEVRWFVSSGS